MVQKGFMKKGDFHKYVEAMLLIPMEVSHLVVTSNCSHTSSHDASLLGYGS